MKHLETLPPRTDLSGPHTCPACYGWGQVEAGYYGDETETCDSCAGKGKLDARGMYRALIEIAVDNAEESLLHDGGGTWRVGFARRETEVWIDTDQHLELDLEELEARGPAKPQRSSSYFMHAETPKGPRDFMIDGESYSELETCRCATPPARMRTVTVTLAAAEAEKRREWHELEQELNRCYCESCQKESPELYV